MTRILCTAAIMLFLVKANGQEGRQQNLYFIKVGYQPSLDSAGFKPAKTGFYIYRNCIYDFVLKNKMQFEAKVTDIKKDSIFFTKYLNWSNALENKERLDTFSFHPSQLRKIKLIGDRTMSIYSGYGLGKYSYVFEETENPKEFRKYYTTVYSPDSSHSTEYEVVPYLTLQGIDMIYEQCGATFYYRGISEPECADTARRKFISKKGVWFSPSNANEVRGVNIGLMSMNFNGDSLSIKGLNLNADIPSMLFGCMGLFYAPYGNALINMPDSADKSEISNRFSGVSLSLGGIVGNNSISGFSLNGGICTAIESKGVVITGSQNLIDEFNGVSISALRNRSLRGKGLQIGLLNVCKNLKGLQIGLWNVNSKRKLPFINWSF